MGNTTHGESVQPLQSVKLVYQPCSRTRAAWILTEQLVTWMVWVMIKVVDISNIHIREPKHNLATYD